MKGYLIANVEIENAEAYARYRAEVPGLIAEFGGRYLARGGAVTDLEGDNDWSRVVIVEFPSVDAALRFYRSDAYQRILPFRQDNARSNLVVVEGV